MREEGLAGMFKGNVPVVYRAMVRPRSRSLLPTTAPLFLVGAGSSVCNAPCACVVQIQALNMGMLATYDQVFPASILSDLACQLL